MVFQNYALYPHMTVYKNMAFGLRISLLAQTCSCSNLHKAEKGW
jgi:ABC-type sugar transport system ATPase subunit